MNTLRLLIPLVLVAAGCSDDFEPYSHLGKLRVLAMQSEPPAPAPGEAATLTSLVYLPGGAAAVERAWSWCPLVGAADKGHPCLLSEADLAAAGAGAPPFDLGSGETATLPNTFDPAFLRAFCTGVLTRRAEAASPPQPIAGGAEPFEGSALNDGSPLPAEPDCAGGLAVTVRLTARTADDQVTAVSTVRLRFDEAGANANPRIDGLTAVVDGQPQPMDDSALVTLPRDAQTPIAATVPEDSAEPFVDEKNGTTVPARERLVFTWFVETGEPKSPRTSFIDGVVPLQQALENDWKVPPEATDPRQTARLILVARDSRGGVAWRSATVKLGGGQ